MSKLDGLDVLEEYFGKGFWTRDGEIKFYVGVEADTDTDIKLRTQDFERIEDAARRCAAGCRLRALELLGKLKAQSKCEQCAFMVIEYPTLSEPGGGCVRCIKGEWEDYSPPETGFEDCEMFEEKQPEPEPVVCDYEPVEGDVLF